MTSKWREISACTYCKNYNKRNSYCNQEENKKELTIYNELKGCEKIIFTGGLKLELFSEIPRDSILRALSINHLSKYNSNLENNITSQQYGDYFNDTKSIKRVLNLSKLSSGEAKVISFEKFKEARERFEHNKAFNRMLNNLPLHLK